MIIGSNHELEERPWTVRMCPGEKGRHNHQFLVYRDGHVRATRLIVDKPALIMTFIYKAKFPWCFCLV